MSLQFYLGNSGSGKSYEIYQKIIKSSQQSPQTQHLVIVPEQFTMQIQKELVSLHPDRGILNIDILSFQRLAYRIFEEVGADRRTVLEETGKTLLLRRAAGKHQNELQVLKGNLKKKGYLAQVKSLISEFNQYDIDADKMDKMLQAVQDKPRLYYKLKDLELLYGYFQEELEGKYITSEEILEALCQVVNRSGLLKDCVIALDGFTGFTPVQMKLLEHLMVLAKEVYVTVTIDSRADFYRIYGEHELFYLSKKTIRGVSELARKTGCEILEPVIFGGQKDGGIESPRFHNSPQLAFLEQHLFREKTAVMAQEVEDISIHVVANPAKEAHYVAREIRKLIRQGARYQDMAIIVGDMEAYRNYLPHVFAKYDIPVFLDSTRAVFSNPFVEFIRAALEMVQKDYARVTVFRLLRTGLCELKKEQIDLLENYVLASGIRGFARWNKSFDKVIKGFDQEQVQQCEEMRAHLMEHLGVFTKGIRSSKGSAREKTIALYELITGYQIQNQLDRYEKQFQKEGKRELQKEYGQVYALVMGLFDKLVELLGEENLSLSEYTELLEAGFEELKVGIIPPSMDQIQVGDLTRTRLKDIRFLFFLGMNDGWVPSGKAGGGLLSEIEREELRSSGVELSPTARQDAYIQKFYLYLTLTKPSEKLYLSYCKSGSDGTAMRPSYIIRTIKKIFPGLQEVDEENSQNLVSRAVSPEMGLQELAQGMRTLQEKQPEEDWLELLRWYWGKEEFHKETEKLLEAAFLRFSDKGIGEIARKLYGETLVNSVSRLEKFASCAMAHFLQYGLQLKEKNEYTFQPVDTGNIVHRAVELFSRKMKEQNLDWKTLEDSKRNQLAEECVEEITEEYRENILHSSARNEAIIQRIRRIIRRTVWALQKQIAAGEFVPENFEVAFSQVSALETANIVLSDTEKMRLQGRIDRIDICEKEEEVYVKVIDYKSGNTSFDLNALYYGLQLQLMVYLNAAMELEKRVHPDKKILPAGIFYYHVKDPVVSAEANESMEEVEKKLLRELRLNGIVNEEKEIYQAMDQHMEKSSDVIPVTVNKDGSLSRLSKAVSTQQFERLARFVQDKMQKIGKQIMDGEITANPFERKTQTACDYCVYHSVCSLDRKLPGTHMRRLKELSEEEIWERLEKEQNGDELDE
ncbi:MAG: helicase-exonuclease AddAB subunit AddB [Muricoprocola sp.]